MGLTVDLAGFVADLQFDSIPPRAVLAARVGIADCIGVMLAGCDEEAPRIVSKMVRTAGGAGSAVEFPSGRPLDAPDAALVNGTAAHVLDYDDVAIDGHPSAVLTPALLAEGWASNASGRDILTAYIAGYELWAALVDREPGHLHDRGFHPTAVWGTLAAAAACARLRRFDHERTTRTIALAASLASGLVGNFGSMTKSLHAGRAAQAGILAARLAEGGFTASVDVLEHRSGFLRAHSPSGRPNLEVNRLNHNRKFRIVDLGVNIKRYPVCYGAHRSIDAMLNLTAEHNLLPKDVASIDIVIGATQRLMLRNSAPKTALEAKFSIEFALAAALHSRKVGLEELEDAFVQKPEIVSVFSKVKCSTTDETMPDLPFAPADSLSVTLSDGRVLTHAPVAYARGSWQNPMSDAELKVKFLDCAGSKLGDTNAGRLFDQLTELEDLTSLRNLPMIKDR